MALYGRAEEYIKHAFQNSYLKDKVILQYVYILIITIKEFRLYHDTKIMGLLDFRNRAVKWLFYCRMVISG